MEQDNPTHFDNLNNSQKVDYILEIFEKIALSQPGNKNIGMRIEDVIESIDSNLTKEKLNELALVIILEGYIEPIFEGTSIYRLSSKGATLLIQGGYESKYIRELLEDKIQETQLELNQQMIKHNKATQWAIWLGVIFSLTTLLLTLIQYLDNN